MSKTARPKKWVSKTLRDYQDNTPGQVVVVKNARHKHVGAQAVVQTVTPKMYQVRLLKKIPKRDRFYYSAAGGVSSAVGAHEVFLIKKASVRRVRGKTAPRGVNMWQPDTLRLLETHFGWTRQQVEAKFTATQV